MSAEGTSTARLTTRTAAVLAMGAMGVVSLGVQSAMYGSLERAGRIGVTEIGIAASAEMVALAVGVAIAGKLASRWSQVGIALCGGTGLLIANCAMPFAAEGGIITLRVLAGGLLLWLANAYIVLSHRVVRLAALFLVLQTCLQFSAAAAAARFFPENPDALPLVMAVCGALVLILSAAAKGWHAVEENRPTDPQPAFSGNALLALALMAMLQFTLVGGWILVELVGGEARLSPEVVAAATPLMLAAQVVGGLLAVALARHTRWVAVLLAVGAALASVQWGLANGQSAAPFLLLACAYGLLWNFALPQLTPMVLAADPSLRTARIGPAAVVAGAALGPFAAATLAERMSPSLATAAFAGPSLAVCALVAVLRVRLQPLERNAIHA